LESQLAVGPTANGFVCCWEYSADTVVELADDHGWKADAGEVVEEGFPNAEKGLATGGAGGRTGAVWGEAADAWNGEKPWKGWNEGLNAGGMLLVCSCCGTAGEVVGIKVGVSPVAASGSWREGVGEEACGRESGADTMLSADFVFSS